MNLESKEWTLLTRLNLLGFSGNFVFREPRSFGLTVRTPVDGGRSRTVYRLSLFRPIHRFPTSSLTPLSNGTVGRTAGER